MVPSPDTATKSGLGSFRRRLLRIGALFSQSDKSGGEKKKGGWSGS
jgi:hypothetical protein